MRITVVATGFDRNMTTPEAPVNPIEVSAPGAVLGGNYNTGSFNTGSFNTGSYGSYAAPAYTAPAAPVQPQAAQPTGQTGEIKIDDSDDKYFDELLEMLGNSSRNK